MSVAGVIEERHGAPPAASEPFMDAELGLLSGSVGEPLRRQIRILVAEVHGCPASLALRAAMGRAGR
jgi:hypothetical protein